MKRFMFLSVMVMLFAFCASAYSAETITVVADQWCPYNCDPKSASPGFGIEIMKEVFEPQGIKVAYKVMDWDKAIKEARAGKYTAIIGAYKDDAPDFVFPDHEFGASSNQFYVLKENPWRFNGIDSLKGKRVGIIESYSYGDDLDKFFKANPKGVSVAKGDNPLDDLIKKLVNKEIDIVLEDHLVFLLKAREHKIFDKVADAGRDSEPVPVYIAFSPKDKNAKRYAKMLSDGMVRMKASGRIKEIYQKYGLEE